MWKTFDKKAENVNMLLIKQGNTETLFINELIHQ